MIFIKKKKKKHDQTPFDGASKDTCILNFGYADAPTKHRNRFLKHERYICYCRSYNCSVFETNNKLFVENIANNEYINKKIKKHLIRNKKSGGNVYSGKM